MNLLIVPSWYPSRIDPVNGIFVRDQARAIAALRPEWNVSVSAVSALPVALTRPRTWSRVAHRGNSERRAVAPNLVEHRRSEVVWTTAVRAGNRDGILAAHRVNARAALQQLGRLDLIHAHVAYPGGWVAMRLAEELDLPFVVTEHMGPFPFAGLRDGAELKAVVRAPLQRASETIAVSPMLAADVARFGLDTPTVVPNLVDETFFTPGEKTPSGPTFFTLAALLPEKGIGDLLQAIALVRDRGVAAAFRIAGGGEQAHKYRDLAAALGIAADVTWLGPLTRDAVRGEFRRATCVVLASHHESFGVVLAEAMACGVPVVATRCGGPEWIVSDETGVLVEPRDPAALADGIELMLTAPRDGDAIRRRFEERFSRPVVVDQLEEVYARATSRK